MLMPLDDNSVSRVVYIVTTGGPESYELNGVFSSRRRAQEYIDLIPDHQCNGVEEVLMDPDLSDIKAGFGLYEVRMLRDGSTEYVEACEKPLRRYQLNWKSGSVYYRSKSNIQKIRQQPDVYIDFFMAKNEGHAVRLCSDKMFRMIAAGGWSEES